MNPLQPQSFQAELLGHAFYIFRDASAGDVRVVYRREAEGYGVLVPAAE